MKKQFKIFIAVAVFWMISGCTDLDVKPKTIAVADIVLSTPESYKSFLAKLYAGLAVTGQQGPAGNPDIGGIDEGFSSYIRAYWKAQELTTDEAVITWGDEGIQDFHLHNWTAQNQFITALYYRIFYQISLANEFLRETTGAKLEERGTAADLTAAVQVYRAEARFLRALSYWHALDLFGSTIFVTETDEVGTSYPAQASKETLFNFIADELTAIEADMIAPGQNEYGRADKAAAWALLARLYLNAEVYVGSAMYTECITYCQRILDAGYTLDEEYQNLFNLENPTSSEIIFAVNFDGDNTRTFGGTNFIIHASVGGTMDPAAYGIDGGWAGLRTTSALVNLFPDETGATDERAIFYTDGQSKEISNITDFSSGYAVTKFTNTTAEGDAGSNPAYASTDFPIFRLADVYLMYAEAVARGGSGGSEDQAVTYVNLLRERAYDNTSGNITAAQLTLDFILDERARELYWEALRRTDLIRFNQFTENGVWPWKGNVPQGKPTESFRDVFPIPSAELIANPNLKQNDGY